MNPCGPGFECNSGVCEATAADGGTQGSSDGSGPSPRIQVCTPEGCDAPLHVNFGGSRIGVSISQIVVIRSVGEVPVKIQNVSLLGVSTEITVDPMGDVNMMLAP